MSHSNKAISPLRQRMIEDMTLRKLGAATQLGYIRAVVRFTRFLGRSPDTATAEELRQFQLHLVEAGVSSITINATLTGLKFFFEQTLDKPALLKKVKRVYEPRKIPEVLSVEEVTRVLEAVGSLKYKAALSIAYGAGLRASEIAHLKITDIDSDRILKWHAFDNANNLDIRDVATRCSRDVAGAAKISRVNQRIVSGAVGRDL